VTLDVSLDGEALVAVGTAELVGVRLVLLHHVGAHLLLSNILINKQTINQINSSLLHMRRKLQTTKLILLDSLLQEIKSWGAQLKQRQNENTA
jgi:hypothetical protein